jgi:anaphase-promoting complex subunit 8
VEIAASLSPLLRAYPLARACLGAREFYRAHWLLERAHAELPDSRGNHAGDRLGAAEVGGKERQRGQEQAALRQRVEALRRELSQWEARAEREGREGRGRGQQTTTTSRGIVGQLIADELARLTAQLDPAPSPHAPSAPSTSSIGRAVRRRAFFLQHYALYLEGERRRELTQAEAAPLQADTATATAEGASASTPGAVIGAGAGGAAQRGNPFLATLAAALGPRHRRQTPQGLEAALHVDNNEQASADDEEVEEEEGEGLDAFGLYLYGTVLRGQGLREAACEVLVESVRHYPLLWSAWLDLAALCRSMDDVAALDPLLPRHWMADLFRCHCAVELQSNAAALQQYRAVALFFPRSSYLQSQTGRALYNLRQFDLALAVFAELRRRDPFRLDEADTLSNILYVKDDAAALSSLAHALHALDRYRPETCVAVGNFYSLRGQHEKAVLYFRRGLRLDRRVGSAWTLMGHEFVELKNTTAAAECYRRAVEVNARDFRAWYGLGQTYELLQLPLHAAYFYRRAVQLRAFDPRMWCALGQVLETLRQTAQATACYHRAAQANDRDGIAALRLARLYKAAGDASSAAHFYASFVEERERSGAAESSPECMEGLLFLAHAALRKGLLADAEAYAQRAAQLPFPQERHEALAVLSELAAARGTQRRRQTAYSGEAGGAGAGAGGGGAHTAAAHAVRTFASSASASDATAPRWPVFTAAVIDAAGAGDDLLGPGYNVYSFQAYTAAPPPPASASISGLRDQHTGGGQYSIAGPPSSAASSFGTHRSTADLSGIGTISKPQRAHAPWGGVDGGGGLEAGLRSRFHLPDDMSGIHDASSLSAGGGYLPTPFAMARAHGPDLGDDESGLGDVVPRSAMADASVAGPTGAPPRWVRAAHATAHGPGEEDASMLSPPGARRPSRRAGAAEGREHGAAGGAAWRFLSFPSGGDAGVRGAGDSSGIGASPLVSELSMDGHVAAPPIARHGTHGTARADTSEQSGLFIHGRNNVSFAASPGDEGLPAHVRRHAAQQLPLTVAGLDDSAAILDATVTP